MDSLQLTPHLKQFYLILFLIISTGYKGYSQLDCNCKPQIEILSDKCIKQGSQADLGFYIYDKTLADAGKPRWIKVYTGNRLLVDKEIHLSDEGFYSQVIKYVPDSDTQVLVEFHCEKDKCFNSVTQLITTMPFYDIEAKDVTCKSNNDGEVKLVPSAARGLLDIVWESGDHKDIVTGMSPGIYKLTVSNSNGCVDKKNVSISEPNEINIQEIPLTFQSQHGISNYIQLKVTGGKAPYSFDWDMDGMGDKDDKSSVRFINEENHNVAIYDNNGCKVEKSILFKKTNKKPFSPISGSLSSIEDMGDGKFKYNLRSIFDVNKGDMDGDGINSTVFDYQFKQTNGTVIPDSNLDQFISSEQSVTVLLSNNDLDAGIIQLDLLSGPDYCLFISQACDNNPPVELLPVECTAASPALPSGGVYEVFNYNPTTGIETPEPQRLVLTGGKYYFDPTDAVDNYRIYYTVDGVRRRALFNVHGVTAQITLQSDSICGNFNQLFEIRVNSIGGVLSGEHILKDFKGTNDSILIVGTNEFHFLRPTDLTVNQTYKYSYTFTRVINSKLTCSETNSAYLKVLPFPGIAINQFDNQVCAKEKITFTTSTAPTSGSLSQLAYQWYFLSGDILEAIPNTNNSQLIVPEAIGTGDFIVKVTQSNGCMGQDTGRLEVINLPLVNSEVLTAANCFGVASARVEVDIAGVSDAGYNDYSIHWVGKKTMTERYGRYQENLPADSFLITVTTPPLNQKGLKCSITDTVVILSNPSIGLDCTPKDTSIACFGTFTMSRTVKANPNADRPLSYSIESKDGPFLPDSTFTGLGVGTDRAVLSKNFKIYVKDRNGCLESCDFILRQPDSLFCSLEKTDLTCYNGGNGSVDVKVAGGVPPYTFKWSNNVPDGQTTSSILGLSAGDYSVSVTDANGCTDTCSITVNQPQRVSISLAEISLCLDYKGQMVATASGGTGPYTYTWALSDAGDTGATAANLAWDSDENTLDFDAWCLKPGAVSIRVTATDKNGCTGSVISSISLRSCFDLAIRKTVALPSKKYFPGDSVTFNLDIFNQGTVDASDLTITDILDDNMQYLLGDNTASKTGNENDWVAGSGNTLLTSVDSLSAGKEKRLKVILKIKDTTSNNYMVNFAEITSASSVKGERIKKDPIDEDNFTPDPPGTKSTERDDEICDESITNSFPDECHKMDDPMDEDRLDYAVVTICQLKGSEVDKSLCVDTNDKTDGLQILEIATRDELDPEGNGDGIAIGDNGNLVTTFHNTYMDAMTGTKAITGRIIFQNGSGGNNSTNGILTPHGDLKVFADQEIEIFARLVALDSCIGVSVLTLDFSSTATIESNPESQIAVVDQENLCFKVETDAVAGITYSYQWQQFDGTVFADIPGATGVEYCVEKVTESLDGTQFRVLVTDPNDTQGACAAISSIARLELDDDPVLVCNDLVNISLDDNCQVLITPEMVLEAARLTNRLVISIKDANGNPVPNPVTSQYVGQLLTVSVIDNQTGNSCWSKVRIEDKLPPVIVCPEDYNVSCANIYFTPPVPYFYDACDVTANISLLSDIKEDLDCNRPDGIIAVRTLTYIAKDKYGNTSRPCTFHVYYHTADLDDIVWPDNKVYECTHALVDNVPGTGVAGLPMLDGFPLYPASAIELQGYCRINVAYDDQVIPLCGNSYKVARSWTVLDWCRGTIGRHTQLIAVKDTQAPQLVCPEEKVYEVLMDGHDCSADFAVPAPVVSYDCNDTYWSASYFVDAAGGTSPQNGVYITDNLTQDAKGVIVHDLPAGTTWVRYAVIDACDNLEYCYVKVVVKDMAVPTPVCDEYTVISLDAQGRARLFAKTIDDGSHDNCSKVTFGIRRMDANCPLPADAVFVANYEGASYYTFVDFCCQDQIENSQQVELLVIDAANNMNTCMTTVEVQQKILPTLNCPRDLTLDCEADYSPQALNSFATFTSPCPVYYLAPPADSVAEYSCGEKTVFRRWQVKENGTNKTVVSCTQHIYIKNLTPFDLSTVKFPANVTLTNRCMNAGDFGPSNPDTGGYPSWTSVGCSQIAVSYTDQVFNVVEDACFKIVRHWTVIDWCTFDLGNPGTVLKHQQIIKVIDTEKPRAICQDVNVNVTEGCSKLVTVIGDGDDTCTPKDQLSYKYSLNGGASVSSRLFSQNLTVGIHELRWTVEDKCGNTSACTQIINVRDAKKPTPYCITELVTVLMPTNLKVAIWAKDYNLGAFDNCSTKLRFTFGPNSPVSYNRAHYYKAVNGISVETTEAEYLSGNAEYWDPVACSSSRMFSCPDLGLHTLDIYVWDEAGNNDYCTVRIKIQDNSGICGQSRNTIANGTVESVRDLAMEGVVITFKDDLGGETFTGLTDPAGAYSADRFLVDVPYVVSASRDGDWLNGVSTLDLVMIQRHILGLQPLQDKRLLLAADANADGKVTASDLTDLRKLILGQSASLPKNKSWIFIHNQEGNDLLTPWEMPRVAYFTAQPEAVYTNDFTGIKVGDVNLNASANAGDPNTSARNEQVTAVIGDLPVNPGKTQRIPVYAGDISSVLGLQLSMIAAPGVTVHGLESGVLDIAKSDRHIFKKEGRQMINISWNAQTPVNLRPEDILFEIAVSSDSPVSSAAALQLNSEGPAGEVTDAGLNARGLKIRSGADSDDSENVSFKIKQNVPNPFSDQTTVRYTLPENDEVEILLTDVDGKVLYRKKDKLRAGNHEMTVTRSMTGRKSGVFLFTVGTSKEKATIRMIQIE